MTMYRGATSEGDEVVGFDRRRGRHEDLETQVCRQSVNSLVPDLGSTGPNLGSRL